jgi:hypothetical protein
LLYSPITDRWAVSLPSGPSAKGMPAESTTWETTRLRVGSAPAARIATTGTRVTSRRRARHQRQVEEQLQGDGAAHDLGEVSRDRDRLGLEPVADPHQGRQPVADVRGERAVDDQAELGREVLDKHSHQVGNEDHPDQGVAVAGTGGHVGRDVARIDVGNRRDEGGAKENQSAGESAGPGLELTLPVRPTAGRPILAASLEDN